MPTKATRSPSSAKSSQPDSASQKKAPEETKKHSRTASLPAAKQPPPKQGAAARAKAPRKKKPSPSTATSTGAYLPLRVQTQYSLLSGAVRIADLPSALKEAGYSACAITDRGNLHGCVEFHETLRGAGLHPILGLEAYVADEQRTKRDYPKPGANAAHLVLLCENRQGYENLIRLASAGYLEGHYFVPRIDRELLAQHHEGLFALCGGSEDVLSRPLRLQGKQAALEAARWYAQVFQGRCYVGLQREVEHAAEEEQNATRIALAKEAGLPLAAMNCCAYLRHEDAYAHYLLQRIRLQQRITHPEVPPYEDRGWHLRSAEEMATRFGELPAEALVNTAEIAAACTFQLQRVDPHWPRFELPSGYSATAWLKQEAQQGLEQRLAARAAWSSAESTDRASYAERLAHELQVITALHYEGYFLIVADFINWAKDHGVRVGPGRGSGAGSLVAYVLRITDIDPLQHGLLFERFLNADRVSPPDFDIDFDVEGRERVIAYVREKYGAEKVCQISTFGSLGAKAALRNVARALDFPYSEADRIAKLIPNRLGITLANALEIEPQLARLEETGNENEQQLIRCGKALEGLNSTLSTHAAGVIIMNERVQDVMPVCVSSKGDGVQSMYGMKWAEHQGALKFDFLGLNTLTLLGKALVLIHAEQAEGEHLMLEQLPLDDPATLQLLARADTTGVFQLESAGMRRLLSELKPDCFEDLVAVLALYRPGPLDSGMSADFVRRKNGQQEKRSAHPLLDAVLADTHGVLVYQEQVMEAAKVLAGFSLQEADLLRRAMGKKDPVEMAAQRARFLSGCEKNGVSLRQAEEIFGHIDKFAGYGFNKSHSAAYGLIAWQTAYLKTHHPLPFMAALLSSDIDNLDKVAHYIAECREMGVSVLPPDVNHSEADFTVHRSAVHHSTVHHSTVHHNTARHSTVHHSTVHHSTAGDNTADRGGVRFGMNAVRHVGRNAATQILSARNDQPQGRFADFNAFFTSVDLQQVNKRALEALAQCGGFDSLHTNRRALLEGLDAWIRFGQRQQQARKEGQENLFERLSSTEIPQIPELPVCEAFSAQERLRREKESLGFYISGHPLERYEQELRGIVRKTHVLREESRQGEEIYVAGILSASQMRLNRSAEKFAVLRLEDQHGSVEVVVFSRLYEKCAAELRQNEPLLVRGRVQVREQEVNLRADALWSLEAYRAAHVRELEIHLEETEITTSFLRRLLGVLSAHTSSGQSSACPVKLHIQINSAGSVWIDTNHKVAMHGTLMDALEAFLHPGDLSLRYDHQAPAARLHIAAES